MLSHSYEYRNNFSRGHSNSVDSILDDDDEHPHRALQNSTIAPTPRAAGNLRGAGGAIVAKHTMSNSSVKLSANTVGAGAGVRGAAQSPYNNERARHRFQI